MKTTLIVNGQHPLSLINDRYIIGRGEGCDILLPEDDASISREHAALERTSDEGWKIIDLGSRNGTYINGRRLYEMYTLQNRDIIKVGRSELSILIPQILPTSETPIPPINQARQKPTMVRESPQTNSIPIVNPAENIPEAASSSYPREPERLSHANTPDSWMPMDAERYPSHKPGLEMRSQLPIILMGLGIAMAFLFFLVNFVYLQPQLSDYESGMGQLAMGISSFFGKTDIAQEYQNLLVLSRVCIGGGIVGLCVFAVGLIMRMM